MERIIILASHGLLAKGMVSSLELICGKQDNIDILCAYLEEDFDLNQSVTTLIKKYEQAEIIVVTDILGGSVNNEFFKYVERENYHLITGMNLPLVVELVTQLPTAVMVEELIQEIIMNNQTSTKYFHDLIEITEEEDF